MGVCYLQKIKVLESVLSQFLKLGGIDLDGVVIDSETTFRTYEEIFDMDNLKGNNLINKQEPKLPPPLIFMSVMRDFH